MATAEVDMSSPADLTAQVGPLRWRSAAIWREVCVYHKRVNSRGCSHEDSTVNNDIELLYRPTVVIISLLRQQLPTSDAVYHHRDVESYWQPRSLYRIPYVYSCAPRTPADIEACDQLAIRLTSRIYTEIEHCQIITCWYMHVDIGYSALSRTCD